MLRMHGTDCEIPSSPLPFFSPHTATATMPTTAAPFAAKAPANRSARPSRRATLSAAGSTGPMPDLRAGRANGPGTRRGTARRGTMLPLRAGRTRTRTSWREGGCSLLRMGSLSVRPQVRRDLLSALPTSSRIESEGADSDSRMAWTQATHSASSRDRCTRPSDFERRTKRCGPILAPSRSRSTSSRSCWCVQRYHWVSQFVRVSQ